MILYFSGTGNSAYVAERIGRVTGEPVVDLFEKIRDCDFTPIHADDHWVVVAPTYAWRIPRILQEWLKETDLSGSRKLYFVITCGGSAGNAGKYLQRLCASKKMAYCGCFPIVMPENYIAMFTTPDREEALAVIDRAETAIDQAAALIAAGVTFPPRPVTETDRLNSGIVNDLFYPMCVHAKKFYVKDSCISCGKCAQVCPLRNIRLERGRPVWGGDCTHCMACICRCPSAAIEYGKHSVGLPRYTCPK